MEAIGKQVRLPMGTAMQIALQGIKIRLGRALVTISGVVLGIAFLMNAWAGKLISSTVEDEQNLRTKVDMMVSLIKNEVGDPGSKQHIAVVACGPLTEYERETIRSLKQKGTHLIGVGFDMPGVSKAVDASQVAQDSEAVLVMGQQDCPVTADVLTAGILGQKVILDTKDDRKFGTAAFTAPATSGIVRDLFFGTRAKDEEQQRQKQEEQKKFRRNWMVSISLLVTIIGIANALLMSVTERFKEIGTMKCLGALSGFIRQLFLIESAVIGAVGSVVGILVGVVFPMLAYSFAYGFKSVWGAMDYGQLGWISLGCLFAGTILSIFAAIYPATIAAKMIPAMALRSNV